MLREARSMHSAGDPYATVLRLGRVQHVLRDVTVHRPKLEEEFKALSLSEMDREKVRSTAEGEAKRLLRILNGSGSLEIEEVYLIVSLRIDLELVRLFISQHWNVNIDLPLSEIDTEVRQLRGAPGTNAQFSSVIRKIRENTGLSLEGTSVDEYTH